MLLVENISHKAQMRKERWNEAREAGELILQKRCGDARTSLTKATQSVDIRSIACGGPDAPYNNLINHQGVKMAVKLTHFDAEEFILGEVPLTCGGLDARHQGLSGEQGIGCYIENDVDHFDPTVQACLIAAEAAEHTDKIVAAGMQDHITGEIIPVAVFADRGRKSACAIPPRKLYESLYYPHRDKSREIYQNGLPHLSDNEIPDEMLEFLFQNRSQVEEMKEMYPDLSEIKKVQNPGLILISTDIRPAVVRYPSLEAPGSFFELRVPRQKMNGNIQIDVNELERVLNQAEYPITHATHNFGKDGKSFAHTRQLLIETRNMNKSRHLAEAIVQKPWMQEWLKIDGIQVLTAQTVSGELQDVDYFNPNL